MRAIDFSKAFLVAIAGLVSPALLVGCGGKSSTNPIMGGPVQPAVYTLTIASSDPASGVTITASPADLKGKTTGNTNLNLSYDQGTTITLTAPTSSGTTIFDAWTGCGSVTTNVCIVTLNANAAVTAGYMNAPKGVAQVTVSPAVVTTQIGAGQQFAAVVGGTGTFDSTVTWSVAANGGSTADPGTVTAAGAYQSPYPAPATVTVTATSNADPTVSGSATITLQAPSTAAGPTLSVDAAGKTHPINPLIYGMNEYQLGTNIPAQISLPVDRWGGDTTSRYNYLLDVANIDNDYFFETLPNNNTQYPDVSDFNSQVVRDASTKTLTIGTMPLMGYTTKREKACSFSVAKYGPQKSVDQYWPDCGNGVKPDGTNITGNDPADTSITIDESFVSGWVQYLVKRYGSAASGGVSEFELDNEPEFWSSTHRDIHPNASTYDEITNKGLSYATAIKTADPTVEVGGPVIAFFPNYFYSWADLISGWSTGPCYCYNGNPTDRLAHGDVAFLDYYLQHFKSYEDAHGTRLLDYLDLHGYYAANNAAFSPAGDTSLQAARLDSTRAMWDPTFTNSGFTDPTVRNSSAGPAAIQLIPRMRNWVSADYPGTKLAITEYNWGGQEHINGALAQADLLGIFGREGLDLATLWGPPDPVTQVPGLQAYLVYRNYDGAGAKFGDMGVTSTSADQSKLSVYGAVRSSDSAVTVVVINKTFGDLTSTISLTGAKTGAPVKVYEYTAAQTKAIVAGPGLVIAAPAAAGGAGTVSATFPAASITLLVVPKS